MNNVIGFFIYAAIFRLAIIAAGIVSIVLGYKLFMSGVMGKEKTNVNAQAGQIKLMLTNAGPGSVFALFGAFIIVVMLSQGNPEYLKEEYKDQLTDCSSKTETVAAHQSSASQPKAKQVAQIIQKTQMKGNGDNEASKGLQRFDQAYSEGVQRKRDDGDVEGAITAYNKALSESEVPLGKATEVFNELAWIYREQHRTDAALALAHIATTVDRNNANAFDTLALILLDQKDLKAAEQAAEKAVDLDPDKQDYKNTLKQVRTAQENGQ
ncbi:tetratricopeptide repeat protein [Desulfobulbus sp. TB]|nr:tetratricopeptide repeat protein [Desulfobulbus sp. TB]